ncbi:putative Histone-lysine N-methyltransferase, H3 lysine-9specific SUVH3 [Monoraphidium neglectum]|uniref:Putative Histone-lysine N-methyltransferase, H3 lysine-9specific SUVH3 n=1 Tax=Monoraphidium neglectum TaxID=145388 RepID=A0A0D2JKA5_9CHLO|nr:putative Histone-lysine N-methyltransferase, H3 lysine-9specific SUVH3 [Monoraphidium neglectum]KIY99667.1 putative Histone-lysine N-methyltransferase, H3 lysine-9specific SUVH3 [Monoraphidium neglectum]|eukprot:XP_013898687.1 putative Histone-lysine N-methyltransferase, H3 lysine-9specific SUVH3 [Monoraphidium neglectum]
MGGEGIADRLRGQDNYLFDLSHFHDVQRAEAEERAELEARRAGGHVVRAGVKADRNPNMPLLEGGHRTPPPPPPSPALLPRPLRQTVSACAHLDTHLVIDARLRGNVARFVNHSCDPNCLVQTVLSGFCRSHVLYYAVIVTGQDIPAGTELTYDYQYTRLTLEEAAAGATVKQCRCGAANCVGDLLA